MLTPLDDTLLHQAPTTFDHAVTSDHRFFDRWAVGVQHERASVVYGIAFYKNTDVCDGFLCVQIGDHQHNLRVTRALRPDHSTQVGPLRVEILEPLVSHRLVVDGHDASDVRGELTWTGSMPPREEEPHFDRRAGRVVQDYCRLDQLGSASGWVEAGGERVELDGAWAWRDHSWGVRPGVGGTDPAQRHPATGAPSHHGSLFLWLAFEAGSVAGQFQIREQADLGPARVDGYVLPDTTDPAAALDVTGVAHDIAFVDGCTAISRASLAVTTGDGRRWRFEAVPLRAPWVFTGAGYSGGWEDGLGLGAVRGTRVEADRYRLVGPAEVEMPDGTTAQPWHREHDVSLAVDGVAGDGHLTIIAREPLPGPTIGAVRS